MKTSQVILLVFLILCFPITAVTIGVISLIKYPQACRELNAATEKDQAAKVKEGDKDAK